MTKVSPQTILDIWNLSDADRKAKGTALSLRKLTTSADGYLNAIEERIINAQASLDKSLSDSKEKPDFSVIAKFDLELTLANKELDRAIVLYKNLFGKEPNLSSRD